MVNASWTARPPDPRCPLASFGSITPDAANPNPVGTPAGFLVFGQFPPRYSARIPKYWAGGSGLGSQTAEPFAIGCPAVTQRGPLVRYLPRPLPVVRHSCAPDSGHAEHHSHSPTRSLGLRLACASELSGPCKQVTVKSVVAVYSHYSAASMVDLAPLRRGFFMRVLPRAMQPMPAAPVDAGGLLI